MILPRFGGLATPSQLYRQTSIYADLLQKYVRDSQWVDVQSPWLIWIATLRFEFSDDSSDLSHCENLRLRKLKYHESRKKHKKQLFQGKYGWWMLIWVFPKNRGVYPPKWMMKIMEKTPMNKWMIWGVKKKPYFWFNIQGVNPIKMDGL